MDWWWGLIIGVVCTLGVDTFRRAEEGCLSGPLILVGPLFIVGMWLYLLRVGIRWWAGCVGMLCIGVYKLGKGR